MALRLLNLFEDRLETFLKFAPVLGSCNQGSHVKSNESAILQPFWNISPNHPQGQALDDSRFANTRISDEDRVVLRPPGQDLNDPSDLFVSANDRIELPLSAHLSQISTISL